MLQLGHDCGNVHQPGTDNCIQQRLNDQVLRRYPGLQTVFQVSHDQPRFSNYPPSILQAANRLHPFKTAICLECRMARGIPMSRRNWKRIQPSSLRAALELCKDFAKERHNLSVERIAEQMGLTDHWTVYKWIQTGRIPANMILPYETVCGIDFVTRWLAASAGRLLIDIPTGRKASATDMQVLQELLNTAVGQLLQFYGGKTQADETLGAIQQAMEGLAWHKGNVQKHLEPELDFQEV